jgi:hypothetical protein
MRRWWRAGLALAATAVLYLPLCGLVFRCGCTFPLLGGAAHCDVHQPGPPDCPLCAGPPLPGLLFGLAVFALCWAALGALSRRVAVRRSAA